MRKCGKVHSIDSYNNNNIVNLIIKEDTTDEYKTYSIKLYDDVNIAATQKDTLLKYLRYRLHPRHYGLSSTNARKNYQNLYTIPGNLRYINDFNKLIKSVNEAADAKLQNNINHEKNLQNNMLNNARKKGTNNAEKILNSLFGESSKGGSKNQKKNHLKYT